ncbi:hypothetical protein MKC66_21040 [[Clostridium] innocuum]|nr:hypothetical protein [[Clostridium] innocuum]
MKKLLALGMAAMMCAMAGPVYAADETQDDPRRDNDKEISSEETSQEASGEVWALLSKDPELDQMKVTVPIRLHFAVLNRDNPDDTSTPLKFQAPHKDKYAVVVDKDSSVGVKVTGVKFEKPQNGAWTLVNSKDAAEAVTGDAKTVAIQLNGEWMKLGENPFTTPLKVEVNTSKALELDGSASKSAMPEKADGLYEKAFNVTYTLEMDKPEVTPAP